MMHSLHFFEKSVCKMSTGVFEIVESMLVFRKRFFTQSRKKK